MPSCPVCECAIPHGSASIQAEVKVNEYAGETKGGRARWKMVRRIRSVHPSCDPMSQEQRQFIKDRHAQSKEKLKRMTARSRELWAMGLVAEPKRGRDLNEPNTY